MACLLGIDFGTTNTKAVIFAEDGRVLSSAVRRTPTEVQGHMRAVYHAAEIWQTVASTIKEALDGLTNSGVGTRPAVDALAISSMAEAGVPLDAAGRELFPIIAWFDDRSSAQRDWWREHLGAASLFAICGLHLDYIFSVNKLMWLREHEPDVWRRTTRWLCMSDYLSYRLCGQQAISPSIASRTMAFDVARRAWSETILGLAQIPVEFFPEVRESGTLIGHVTAQAAADTGLLAGTPVCVGGHDHLCGALACQVYHPGPVLNSVGTSEVVFVAMKEFAPRMEQPERRGFSCGCHVMPGMYYALGGVRSAGPLNEWLRSFFAHELMGKSVGLPPDVPAPAVYQALAELGLSSPPGARGLFVLPFVAGGRPHRDPEARGVLFGLRSNHTAADIVRAAFEGLSYELRWDLEMLEAFSGNPVQRLTAIGGGARNDLWLRVKADITGKAVEVPTLTESSALGAALLAGVGTGVYPDLSSATRRTYQLERVVEPDLEAHERYSRWYEKVYLPLYPLLRDSFLTAAKLFPEA